MKITKSASGKKEIRISKSDWQNIGKKAGWATKNSPIQYYENVLQSITEKQEQRKKEDEEAGNHMSAQNYTSKYHIHELSKSIVSKEVLMNADLDIGSILRTISFNQYPVEINEKNPTLTASAYQRELSAKQEALNKIEQEIKELQQYLQEGINVLQQDSPIF